MSSLTTVVGPIGTIPLWVLGPSGTFSGLAPATFPRSLRKFVVMTEAKNTVVPTELILMENTNCP